MEVMVLSEFLFAKRAGFITATTAIPGCQQKNYQENIFSLADYL